MSIVNPKTLAASLVATVSVVTVTGLAVLKGVDLEKENVKSKFEEAKEIVDSLRSSGSITADEIRKISETNDISLAKRFISEITDEQLFASVCWSDFQDFLKKHDSWKKEAKVFCNKNNK